MNDPDKKRCFFCLLQTNISLETLQFQRELFEKLNTTFQDPVMGSFSRWKYYKDTYLKRWIEKSIARTIANSLSPADYSKVRDER
jgi:hypothetical protein